MNTEKIQKILNWLEKAAAYKVNDTSPLLTYDNLTFSDPNGELENQVVYVKWVEDDLDYNIILTEEGLDGAMVEENALLVDDHEGQATKIQVWVLQRSPLTL